MGRFDDFLGSEDSDLDCNLSVFGLFLFYNFVDSSFILSDLTEDSLFYFCTFFCFLPFDELRSLDLWVFFYFLLDFDFSVYDDELSRLIDSDSYFTDEVDFL